MIRQIRTYALDNNAKPTTKAEKTACAITSHSDVIRTLCRSKDFFELSYGVARLLCPARDCRLFRSLVVPSRLLLLAFAFTCSTVHTVTVCCRCRVYYCRHCLYFVIFIKLYFFSPIFVRVFMVIIPYLL